MAKAPKSKPASEPETDPLDPGPVPMGHNLTDAEQKEATYRVAIAAVRRAMAESAKLAAMLKAANKVKTKARNDFKHTTTISLKRLDVIMELAELTRGDIAKENDDFNWMLEMEGLPLGGQSSLFATIDKRPTLIRDQADWEAEGKRAFNRGGPREVPANVPPEFHQAFLKGFADEEERTIWAMANVKPVDRDVEKSRSASAPPLDPEPEEEGCATCGPDGENLPEDTETCPSCGKSYPFVDEPEGFVPDEDEPEFETDDDTQPSVH